MASVTRDELADAVENVTSRQAKLAETRGAQTENQQQAEQPKQDPLIDASREGSAKPARRKGNTKATKRTQQAPQTPAPTDKSKSSGRSEEVVTPGPQATNNASAPAIGRADFVADPETIPQGGGFLCTFTLSRPGLVGLNKLAIYLNDLQDSGSISGWQASGWDDAATKVRALIGFPTHADAITAIKSAPTSRT